MLLLPDKNKCPERCWIRCWMMLWLKIRMEKATIEAGYQEIMAKIDG